MLSRGFCDRETPSCDPCLCARAQAVGKAPLSMPGGNAPARTSHSAPEAARSRRHRSREHGMNTCSVDSTGGSDACSARRRRPYRIDDPEAKHTEAAIKAAEAGHSETALARFRAALLHEACPYPARRFLYSLLDALTDTKMSRQYLCSTAIGRAPFESWSLLDASRSTRRRRSRDAACSRAQAGLEITQHFI